jgi:hypothetical protein
MLIHCSVDVAAAHIVIIWQEEVYFLQPHLGLCGARHDTPSVLTFGCTDCWTVLQRLETRLSRETATRQRLQLRVLWSLAAASVAWPLHTIWSVWHAATYV